MKQKTYYYQFNKFDQTFVAMLLGFIILAYTGFDCLYMWGVVIILTAIWWYKNFAKQPAVIITDKTIKLDLSQPIAWKDIKDAKIKDVKLCGNTMKVLTLNPKKGIKYNYNWLQKHNADFGPFPIPLYGLLDPKDEKEIIQIVKKNVPVK